MDLGKLGLNNQLWLDVGLWLWSYCTQLCLCSVSAGAMVCVGPGGEHAIDLDVAAAENQEFLSTRTSERQEMVVLNDRLAVYIDKVQTEHFISPIRTAVRPFIVKWGILFSPLCT